jgi:O-antigen ligase
MRHGMASSHTLNERPVAPQNRPQLRKPEQRAQPDRAPRRAARRRLFPQLNVSFQTICFWLFVAGLAWVPYWYASAELGTWGANAVLFPGLLALYEIVLLVRNQPHPVAAKHLWIPIVLFAGVIFWIVAQNADWTPSAWHHPIWQMTAEILGRPVESSISVNRNATMLALLRLLTAASVFWLALQLCRHTGRASNFLTAMAIIIVGYAAYGLIGFSVEQSNRFIGRTYATSSFVNHNHFAAYVGVGLVITLGLLFRLYRQHIDEYASWRQSIAAFFEASARQAALLVAGAFVLCVALLLSGSRGGVIASSFGIFTLVTLSVGRLTSAKQRIVVLLSAMAIALVALFFGDNLLGQIADKGLTDKNRWAVYVITLRSIFDAPLWGYGYGTFPDVFAMFRDRSLDVFGTWEQAHNIYLEIFQGLGLVFGSFFLLVSALLAARGFRGAMQRVDNIVPAIAASAAVLLGSHCVVDFSLQIPALTLTFAAVLGAGVAQSWSSRVALHD